MKTFNQLEAGDKLYTINPLTQKIVELTVLEKSMHKTYLDYVVIKTHVLVHNPIGDEIDETTQSISAQVNDNATMTLILNGYQDNALLRSAIPTVVFTDRDRLTTWITQSLKN